MTANNRKTVASAHARMDAMEAKLDQVLALLQADAPAKTVRKPAQKKSPARKAPAKPAKVTKGAQTRETLPRKDWNRTLTAKARLAGGGTYKAVVDAWAQVQAHREAGMTPDQVLALFA